MTFTPSRRTSGHYRSCSIPRSLPSHPLAASPMAIPILQEAVPPPLPPPQLLPDLGAGHDPGWQWGNESNSVAFGRTASVKPGSSLLGGTFRGPSCGPERGAIASPTTSGGRRGSSLSTITPASQTLAVEDAQPEGTHSSSSSSSSKWPSNSSLQGEKHLGQQTLESSSQAYDKQLLSRIGGPNTPKRQSLSYLSATLQAPSSSVESERRDEHLRPLSMPTLYQSPLDSPHGNRWPPTVPSSGAVSPGFWEHEAPEIPRPLTRQESVDTQSHGGSYDSSMFTPEVFPMDDGHRNHQSAHDRSPSDASDTSGRTGVKRRASSPPRGIARDDRMSINVIPGQIDARPGRFVQQLPCREHPASKLHPSHSSISSTSSYGHRQGSVGSSLGVSSIPSSATSYSSGRVSPSGLSPTMELDLRPSNAHASSGKSFVNSMSTSGTQNQRSSSNVTSFASKRHLPDSTTHSHQGTASYVSAILLCECCPKKPKKFNTEEELRLHEAEKQYTCLYCPNRFKNKNEAERHQNSLHLRRHSWSCAALAGVQAAFYSSSSDNSKDACGYCGEEFANPAHWRERTEHLDHVHKFGECNQTKKFFRADHFRQHLKHSHSGTSGKWTNMLETACMREESLPEKRTTMAQGPPTLMVSTSGLQGHTHGGVHAVIPETPNDS